MPRNMKNKTRFHFFFLPLVPIPRKSGSVKLTAEDIEANFSNDHSAHQAKENKTETKYSTSKRKSEAKVRSLIILL